MYHLKTKSLTPYIRISYLFISSLVSAGSKITQKIIFSVPKALINSGTATQELYHSGSILTIQKGESKSKPRRLIPVLSYKGKYSHACAWQSKRERSSKKQITRLRRKSNNLRPLPTKTTSQCEILGLAGEKDNM